MARGFKPGPIYTPGEEAAPEAAITFDEALGAFVVQVSDVLTRVAEVAEGQRKLALERGWDDESAMDWAFRATEFALEALKPTISGV